MHDEPLEQNNLSPAAMEHLDQRIVRALETVPGPVVPADFAARVASQLPASRPVSLTPTHYGYTATLIGTLVTLGALLVLAAHTTGRAAFGLPESLLFAQFIALAVWLSVRRHSLR
jgi:hypothetical protein